MKRSIRLSGLLILVGIFWNCAGDESDSGLVFGDGSGTQGVAGSTARFAIANNYLFVVNDSQLKAFEISNASDPTPAMETDLGDGIETIFGYKNHLFIGGQNGMQIFELLDGGAARFVTQFVHQQTCDPVIANDNYAYITLRGGRICRSWDLNLLITVNIEDIEHPYEVSSQEMINPHGLTFFQGDLYVAEGEHGLKKFSLQDPEYPALDTFFTEIPALDMIGLQNTMIITRSEGILQIGYEADSLKVLSEIN